MEKDVVDVESHVGLARSIVVQLYFICTIWYCTLCIVQVLYCKYKENKVMYPDL